MNIKLTTGHNEKKVLVNWDNVDFAKETRNSFGDDYIELQFNNQCLEIKESLEEIEDEIKKINS